MVYRPAELAVDFACSRATLSTMLFVPVKVEDIGLLPAATGSLKSQSTLMDELSGKVPRVLCITLHD